MDLDERLQKDLSPDIYCLAHNKIVNLEQQCKKQKEVIDKAKALVNNVYNSLENADKPIKFYEELLDILKEVE